MMGFSCQPVSGDFAVQASMHMQAYNALTIALQVWDKVQTHFSPPLCVGTVSILTYCSGCQKFECGILKLHLVPKDVPHQEQNHLQLPVLLESVVTMGNFCNPITQDQQWQLAIKDEDLPNIVDGHGLDHWCWFGAFEQQHKHMDRCIGLMYRRDMCRW